MATTYSTMPASPWVNQPTMNNERTPNRVTTVKTFLREMSCPEGIGVAGEQWGGGGATQRRRAEGQGRWESRGGGAEGRAEEEREGYG